MNWIELKCQFSRVAWTVHSKATELIYLQYVDAVQFISLATFGLLK